MGERSGRRERATDKFENVRSRRSQYSRERRESDLGRRRRGKIPLRRADSRWSAALAATARVRQTSFAIAVRTAARAAPNRTAGRHTAQEHRQDQREPRTWQRGERRHPIPVPVDAFTSDRRAQRRGFGGTRGPRWTSRFRCFFAPGLGHAGVRKPESENASRSSSLSDTSEASDRITPPSCQKIAPPRRER